MTRIQTNKHRDWARENPVLADGELGYIKETKQLKIGDGVTRWNDLPYFGGETSSDGSSASDWIRVQSTAAFNAADGADVYPTLQMSGSSDVCSMACMDTGNPSTPSKITALAGAYVAHLSVWGGTGVPSSVLLMLDGVDEDPPYALVVGGSGGAAYPFVLTADTDLLVNLQMTGASVTGCNLNVTIIRIA